MTQIISAIPRDLDIQILEEQPGFEGVNEEAVTTKRGELVHGNDPALACEAKLAVQYKNVNMPLLPSGTGKYIYCPQATLCLPQVSLSALETYVARGLHYAAR